ncbi:hypothetical protein HDU81_000081 [Chytriomyces hyalinus]|nr:hypothetical protein HDU81_000081 [Chytriomyces hyalinus]
MSGRFTQLQARLDEEARVISESTAQSVRTALEAVEADAQTAAEIVSQLREGNKKVGERVEVVVKVQMKDVFQKVESAVKKELLRFAESVARDVEVVDPDNEALQAQLQQIVAQQLPALLSFGLSLEVALSEYQSNVAQKAQSLYHQFVHTAEMSLSDTFDGRFNAIEEELDAAASSRSKKPPLPKHEVAQIEQVHEQPPAPEPRRQSVTAPRPVTVIPVPSEPPSRPPAVPSRPRPASSIAPSNAEAATPSLPQIAPQSPIDLDLAIAPHDDASTPAEIDSAKPPPVQARNVGLMGDLNRMLAVGPPKKTHGVSVDVAAEENPGMDGTTPRSPLYTSAAFEAPAHANDDEPTLKEDTETEAFASITHDGHDALPTVSEMPSSAPVSPTAGPPPVTPSPAAVASAHNSANSLADAPPKRVSGTHADTTHASTVQPNASGPEKKKSFMGMLSSLTKSRPKAARAMGKKGDIDGEKHKDENEPTTSSDAIASPNDKTEETEPSVKIETREAPTVQIQEPTPIAPVPAEILEKEDAQNELVAPASPIDSPPVSPTGAEPAAVPPRPPVPVPRRPVPAPPSESRASVASDPRRSAIESDSKLASTEDISASTHSLNSGPAPPPRPRPAPRPESSVRPSSSVSQSASSIHEQPLAHASESGDPSASGVPLPPHASDDVSPHHSTTTAPDSEVVDAPARPLVPPKPPAKKIPGIFANQRGHNAMAALASAMNSRLSGSQSQEEGLDKGSDDTDAPVPLTEGENEEHAQASAIPVHMSAEGLVTPRRSSEPQHDPFPQVKLNIKRADNSNSGDDKAIEKHALEWMNQHLASKDIQIDDLYSSLGNGLNLIYALEDATGETVGKYNKRAMLPVHKIDNIAVALNFISKKGINTGFISPQDMMDGNKSKILTLFNYITKKF